MEAVKQKNDLANEPKVRKTKFIMSKLILPDSLVSISESFMA